MSNTAKQLVTTVKTSNKTPVKKVTNTDFNPLAISLSNPAESINAWVNGGACYIVTPKLPPLDNLPVVYKPHTQGMQAVLGMLGVVTYTELKKPSVDYPKGLWGVAVNTGGVVGYINTAPSLQKFLKVTMAQSFGASGKSHNAIASLFIQTKGYNNNSLNENMASKKGLITLTKTKPKGAKHSAEVIETYMPIINNLIANNKFLTKV
mgnify:FL=1|tara:strand:- start:172 stop:792 length:621 start_codon:yes stop_codon:yes gene_type:complete